MKINGQIAQVIVKNEFIILPGKLRANDKIGLNFENVLRFENATNKDNIDNTSRKILYGPLVLGYESDKSIHLDQSATLSNDKGKSAINTGVGKFILTPIYHLMDPEV